MKKRIYVTAGLLGALAVIAGAFGAHALQARLTPDELRVWGTAVQYQFYHVFALLALSALTRVKTGLVNTCYYLFTLGIIFFSGSLYLLACRDLLGWSWIGVFGPITPLGGVLFIGGWISMVVAATKIN